MKKISEYSYEELLDRALSKVPSIAGSRSLFEIPRISVSIIGGRTIVGNFMSVVEYLNRDVKHVVSFLSKEIGAAGYVEGDKLILHGRYDSSAINNALLKYARKYVICPICNSKDTYLTKERRVLLLVCTACGAKSSISG